MARPLKALDIVTAFPDRVAAHVDKPSDSLQDVYSSIETDDTLCQMTKDKFGHWPRNAIMRSAINLHLMLKHDVGAMALQHADFLEDIDGHPVSTIPQGILNSVAKTHPHDVGLIKDIPQLTSVIAEHRYQALQGRVNQLHYPPESIKCTSHHRKKLEFAFGNFHLNEPYRNKNVTYPQRLGHYFVNVGNILTNVDLAYEFLKKNHHLLIKPPRPKAEEQSYMVLEGCSTIAQAIRSVQHRSDGYLKEPYQEKARWYLRPADSTALHTDDVKSITQLDKAKSSEPASKKSEVANGYKVNKRLFEQMSQIALIVGGFDKLAMLSQSFADSGFKPGSFPKDPLQPK